MRVLVTGNKGYIGAVLTPIFQAAGHDVVGLDTDYYQQCTIGDGMPDLPTIRKDIRDLTPADLEGFDAVIHLAALSNDPLGDINPDLTYEINYSASVLLAHVAKKAGVRRFLFSSSCSTYGAAGDDLLTEEAEFNPVTPYGKSKVLVEQEVSKLASDDFSPVYLRNATAYGFSPRMRFDIVLNNLVAWAYTTQLVYLKSDGTPWRPIVHIGDISRAFLATMEAPQEKIHNQAFNIGQNSANYRIRELAEIVKETVPGCRIEYAADAGPDKRNYRVNFDKFQKAFPDFIYQWDARKGAQELYDEYRKLGFSLDEFEGPKYKRVDHIRQLIAEGRLDASLRWVSQPEMQV